MTNGQRGMSTLINDVLTKATPEKSLVKKLTNYKSYNTIYKYLNINELQNQIFVTHFYLPII